jgi:hypothetical protein
MTRPPHAHMPKHVWQSLARCVEAGQTLSRGAIMYSIVGGSCGRAPEG